MDELKHCGTRQLETERLILRRYVAEDADAMYKNWASSDHVTEFLTWPTHRSADVTRRVINMWVEGYSDPAAYHWGIVRKGTDEVIGDIAVVGMNEKTAAAELGWCLGEAWWGQGIMPEAALAVRDFLFDTVGFNRIEAQHDTNNPKSGRVMQKIGMRSEGIRRSAGLNNRGICDVAMYALLRSDRNRV